MQRRLAARHVVGEVDVLEDEAGRERADDRGEAGEQGEPREAEAEAEREGEDDAARAQGEGAAEDPRREERADDDRPDEEGEGLGRRSRRCRPRARVVPSAAAWMTPEMIASTTRPRTSSITAAPRMIRDDGVRDAFASCSTRAVMPTEVAASIAPTKAWAIQEPPGWNRRSTP